MRKFGIVALLCIMGVMGFAVAIALSAPPPGGPPGKDPCEHGNSQKPCRPDPQPDHGKDCEAHGKGGKNEDHCAPPTTTTTTTEPPTTTTTTTPRGVATAAAICIMALGRYTVFGTIDGQPANVSPDTIPGNRSGPTIVTVTLGSDSQLVIVNTAGDCVQSDEPPGTTTSTTPTTPTTTTGTTDTTTTTVGGSDTTATIPTTPTTTTGTTPTTTTPVGVTPPKKVPPVNGNNPPKKKKQPPNNPTGKIPPLCPVGVPANSPNEPCAVQGNG